MSLIVKICGLSTPETLDAAIHAGADWVGFVFHPKSPRFVSMDAARALSLRVGSRVKRVALVVDPDDALIQRMIHEVSPDFFQLHGKETPARVAEIQNGTGIPVIKAMGVSEPKDLAPAADYIRAARHLLIDAKPPRDAAYPGGHGQPFDWNILAGLDPALPFMLSGGLDPKNVGKAIGHVRMLGNRLTGVDVSSGVETAPGLKSIDKIRAFITEARHAA